MVLTGTPAWVGVLVVGLVVTAAVTFGGMRSMTFVQAFGFWLKAVALAVPAVVLVAWFLGSGLAAVARRRPRDVRRPTSVTSTTRHPAGHRPRSTSGCAATAAPRNTVSWAPGPHTVAADTTLRSRPGPRCRW